MPKAEVGSTKYLNNKLKSKGLQRLRWYCQVCERQMRDENGFKMHTQSESHVRQMLVVGEDARKFIQSYSHDFKRDFLQLLRTSHGEKKVTMNHFYQEYIANKEHVHMNATEWPSLTEFAKYLGREGLCRVEEDEKGLQIAWIDNSPEAMKRQLAIQKRERQDRGDEERERAAIREQVRRAQAEAAKEDSEERDEEAGELKRPDGAKITLSFGAKPAAAPANIAAPTTGESTPETAVASDGPSTAEPDAAHPASRTGESAPSSAAPSLKTGVPGKAKNVFATAKKNALAGKKTIAIAQPKKMSEAERIMKEEMERNERKRHGAGSGSGPNKRPRF